MYKSAQSNHDYIVLLNWYEQISFCYSILYQFEKPNLQNYDFAAVEVMQSPTQNKGILCECVRIGVFTCKRDFYMDEGVVLHWRKKVKKKLLFSFVLLWGSNPYVCNLTFLRRRL